MKNEEYVGQNDKVYGRNPVIEALESGRTIDRLYIQEKLNHPVIGKIRNIAKEQGVRYQFTAKQKLDKMTEGANHQGVVAVTASHDYVSVEEILERAEERGESPFIIVCEGLSDPHNLGSIIRTANAAGAHRVIIQKTEALRSTQLWQK